MREIFNNREIATAIWLTIFIGWAMFYPTVRAGVAELIKIILSKYLLITLTLMAIYVGIEIAILFIIKLWNITHAKDTIIWFTLSAFVLVVQSVTDSEKNPKIFQKIVSDSFKLVIFLEFFLNFYVFSLSVELILLPVMTFVALMSAIASTKTEYLLVEKFMKWLQLIFGIFLLVAVVSKAIDDHSVFSIAALKQLTLPPLLTLLFIPFIYAVVLYSCYERLLLRVRFAFKANKELGAYVRRRIIKLCGLNFNRIFKVSSTISPAMWTMKSTIDVDNFFRQLK